MLNSLRLLSVILFLFSLHERLIGQTVEWSNQTKLKSKTSYTQILGENSTGVFLVRCRNNDFRRDLTVERYKPNLTLEISTELPVPAGAILEKLILLENDLIFFYSGKSNVTGKIELSCVKLDLTFKPVGNSIPVCSVDPMMFRDNSNFNIKYSADKSKVVVMYIQGLTGSVGSVITCIGLNDQISQIYSKEYTVDYEVPDVFFSSMECNNEGDFFSIIDFPRLGKRSKPNEPRNFYLFACFGSGKILPFELSNDSVFINEIGLAVNNNNRTVVISGFYSRKHDDHANGEFFYRIDAISKVVKLRIFEEFPKNFIAKVSGSMQNEAGPVISDLFIRKIIPRSDGGCLTVAEKYYETKQAYTFYVNGFPQTSYRVVYNFDEVVIISKNADGTTQFREFVKKNQTSMGDGGYYSSFVTVAGTDKIGLIYNSDVSNEGDVMITTISNKGVADTKVLVKALSYYVQLMPGESKQVSINSSLICTLKDKRFSIMRLIF